MTWNAPLSDEARQRLAATFARLKVEFELREQELREYLAGKGRR